MLVHVCGDASFPQTAAASPTLLLSASTQPQNLVPGLKTEWPQWPRDGNSVTQCQDAVSFKKGMEWGTSTKLGTH